MEITLSPTAATQLERSIAAARGREIAGLLLENSAQEQRIQLAPNLRADAGRVEIPRWWFDRRLERRDASGFRPVAFFHSHVSSLELSDADRASMRSLPLPWIVVLLKNSRLTWSLVTP